MVRREIHMICAKRRIIEMKIHSIGIDLGKTLT
jgi:hypothetical protein